LIWWHQRPTMPWVPQLITLCVFGITLLPFAFWNRSHHGVFSVTPIEGGGGVFNLGYWCGRIPGYPKERAFENFVSDEMIAFVPTEELAHERKEYEREWDSLEASIAPLLTARDSAMRDSIAGRPCISYSYNSRYALAREKAIKANTIRDIGQHPFYYLAFKAYTAVRLWVVGIDRARFEQAGTIGKIGMAGAFLFTLTTFLTVIMFTWRALRRRRLSIALVHPALLWVVYTGLIHVPFAIQTRYTSSARPIFHLLIAISAAALFVKENTAAQQQEKP
jgi:hypothetical protein